MTADRALPAAGPGADRAERDTGHMRRALELAARGWGHVWPNPMVGAVVVREGEVVGEGWHRRFGEAHAEVDALAEAGGHARGATLYVSLEPCNHHGQTPPCTEAIERAGIVRVVYAASDPNPKAAGGGARLRDHGIEVVGGVEVETARTLNAAFFHVQETRTPFVALKYALSLDARLAARPGAPTRITGDSARNEAQRLRGGYSAIAIGIGTALADDPLLTVRDPALRRTPPVRVVFDSDLRLPVGSRLAATIADAPLRIVCAEDAPRERLLWWQEQGIPVVAVPRDGPGLDLQKALAALWDAELRSIFLEGGGRLGSALLRADLVDWLHLFYAPILLGNEGVAAFTGLEAGAPHAVRDAWQRVRTSSFEDDVLVEYRRVRGTPPGTDDASGGP